MSQMMDRLEHARAAGSDGRRLADASGRRAALQPRGRMSAGRHHCRDRIVEGQVDRRGWPKARARRAARGSSPSIRTNRTSADPQADSLGDFRANLERLGLHGAGHADHGPIAGGGRVVRTADRPAVHRWRSRSGPGHRGPYAVDAETAEGGWAALHDVRNRKWPGVSRGLSRLLWTSTTLADVRLADSMAVMKMSRAQYAS